MRINGAAKLKAMAPTARAWEAQDLATDQIVMRSCLAMRITASAKVSALAPGLGWTTLSTCRSSSLFRRARRFRAASAFAFIRSMVSCECLPELFIGPHVWKEYWRFSLLLKQPELRVSHGYKHLSNQQISIAHTRTSCAFSGRYAMRRRVELVRGRVLSVRECSHQSQAYRKDATARMAPDTDVGTANADSRNSHTIMRTMEQAMIIVGRPVL